MFFYEFSTTKKKIRFDVDAEGVAILSSGTKAFISKHAACAKCGLPIGIRLEECECIARRRILRIQEIEAILVKFPNASKEFRHAAKQIWGFSRSRKDLEADLTELRDPLKHFGGAYRIPRALWEALDPLRRRDYVNAYSKKRDAVRKERIADARGTYKRDDIKELWRLQSGECYFCGTALKSASERHPFHVDHLAPLSLGGSQWPDNLALLCARCNQEKYTKSEREYWLAVEARIGLDAALRYIERAALNHLHKIELAKRAGKPPKRVRKLRASAS